MTTPRNEVVQIEYKNPVSTMPLFMPVLILCNTTDEQISENIKINSAKPLRWLRAEKEHDGVAIMVGGGASINDHVDEIKELQKHGGVVFAMNAASTWAKNHNIPVRYQCIADAKPESKELIDPDAIGYIFSSQVNTETMDAVRDPLVWHLGIENIEDLFPEERVKKGGYVILGGGGAVGNSALCAAYALGFRDIHIFGYDSSHRDGESHGYTQTMNALIPTIKIEWGRKEFVSSVAMKTQSEKFMFTSKYLKNLGCKLHVYGDGLLQTMYNTDYNDLTEQQKYQYMWQIDAYRDVSPGESQADFFMQLVKPDSLVIDYGCGTGRGGLRISKHVDVLLMDFADNCRDEEAQALPFIQWDLSKPIPTKSNFGYCTDVMEHIPTNDVKTVINNITKASKHVFFQISTEEDCFGAMIDSHLHLTVKPHKWWSDIIKSLGLKVEWESEQEAASLFYVTKED